MSRIAELEAKASEFCADLEDWVLGQMSEADKLSKDERAAAYTQLLAKFDEMFPVIQ
jgi:hypothetical protein